MASVATAWRTESMCRAAQAGCARSIARSQRWLSSHPASHMLRLEGPDHDLVRCRTAD